MSHNNTTKAKAKNDEPRPKTVLEKQEEREKDPDYARRNLNDELREVYERLQDWDAREHKHTILARYELGEMVQPVESDRHTYGEQAIKQLEVALDWDDTQLYAARRFTRVFTREQAQELSRRRLRNGRPLTWSHIRIINRGLKDAERADLLERTLSESWTVAQLDEHFKDSCVKMAEKGESQREVPSAFDSTIRRQGRNVNHFLERAEKESQELPSLTDCFLELPPEEHTDERAQTLKEHAEKLRRAADEAEAQAEEAESVYQRFLRAMASLRDQASPNDGTAHPDVSPLDDSDDELGDDDGAEMANAALDTDQADSFALAG